MANSDFDAQSEEYEAVLGAQLRFFEGESAYFAEYKVALAREFVSTEPASILDFGCGVGRSIGFLKRAFPKSHVVGADVSQRSLEKARQSHPDAEFFHAQELDAARQFEMLFVAGVFHHIPAEQQLEQMCRCAGLLAPGGHLALFEHNPLNPVTRYVVHACQFDRDATLLRLHTMLRLLRAAQLRVVHWRYTLFFPAALRALRRVEPYLGWVPLGGQYAVHAIRGEP
jgi:trans-aconitate methyltransferase